MSPIMMVGDSIRTRPVSGRVVYHFEDTPLALLLLTADETADSFVGAILQARARAHCRAGRSWCYRVCAQSPRRMSRVRSVRFARLHWRPRLRRQDHPKTLRRWLRIR